MRKTIPPLIDFEKILSSSFKPIIFLDQNEVVLWGNDAFATTTGIPKQQWEHKVFMNVIHPYVNEINKNILELLLKEKKNNIIETQFNKNKEPIWLRWEINYDINSGNHAIIVNDVTLEVKKRQISELSQKLSEDYLTQTNANDYFNAVLSQLLQITESAYGFIGEVFYEDGNPYLKTYAITNISWNKETSDFYNEFAPIGMEFKNLNTLFGYAMKSKAPVIANEPRNHPHKGGIPQGHPPLNAFLGIPVLLNTGEMVGLIGVANKPGGYCQKDVDELKLFLELFGAIIKSKKNAVQKTMIENTLKETLLEKEALLSALNNSAIVSTADKNGTITSVNEIFCQVSGYTQEELIGQNHNIINSGFHEEV